MLYFGLQWCLTDENKWLHCVHDTNNVVTLRPRNKKKYGKVHIWHSTHCEFKVTFKNQLVFNVLKALDLTGAYSSFMVIS